MSQKSADSDHGLLVEPSAKKPDTLARFRHRLRRMVRSTVSRNESRQTNLVDEVIRISNRMEQKSETELLETAYQLRAKAHSHDQLISILPLAYGLVRECSRRVHQQSHYRVQILAGIELFNGGVVEMATGEGKTLATLLPVFLHALAGKGGHVVTANDYLAKRDAEFARPVFGLLGISVGCVDEALPREKRRHEYQRDVTYGTAREFGFDFLKDRLAKNDAQNGRAPFGVGGVGTASESVQRGHHFAFVDEADSVMMDDARTPLLIANASEHGDLRESMIQWCQKQAPAMVVDKDYVVTPRRRTVKLTRAGSRKISQLCDPVLLQQLGFEEVLIQAENALTANHFFKRGQQYVIQEGEVAIVDESTGRISDGRKWQNGLHQAIEAKEGLAITSATSTMARVTVQSFFRQYQHLAGITGTAKSLSREFKKVYDLSVTPIPTRLPIQRIDQGKRIFRDNSSKDRAIALDTLARTQSGQPVLIGTPSVRVSQRVSAELEKLGISHVVLNCLQHDQESTIVSRAGERGRVTVATNMAGRGTDIRISPEVLQMGGLHVIATEMHVSSRIDRQLIGRSARQGQAGSFQFFLSLEDELFANAGINLAATSKINEHRTQGSSQELEGHWLRHFVQAQKQSESLQEKQRFELLERENQRDKICRQIGLDPCLEMLDE